MSDAKEDYSRMVKQLRQQAETDPKLAKQIADAFERKMKYRDNWEVVDINEFTKKFVPDYRKVVENNKLCYVSSDETLVVVSDVGGTYCRLGRIKHPGDYKDIICLDKNGQLPYNYKDKRGKIHGRSKSERQMITHFRIKQRSEMNSK